MYSSDSKSRSEFQKRVSYGLPPDSLGEKRRRILSGLSVTSQKRRLGKKVTFYAAGYKPRSIRFNGPNVSRSNTVGLTQEKVTFRSRIPVSKVSQTIISYVPLTSTPSTFYKFHKEFDANPFFKADLQGAATHSPISSEVGLNQQNLLKHKREAKNVDKTIKLKISMKRIKTKCSELKRMERCLKLGKECFEMLEYLKKWTKISGRHFCILLFR